MKNTKKQKLSTYAIHTLLTGILVPLALCACYIACLFVSGEATYLIEAEAAKVCEFFGGCVIFSLLCAFVWEQLCQRYGLS